MIVPIVEGLAEVESVPLLLRRILADGQLEHIQVARPFRVKRNQIVREGELERAMEQAIRDREHARCVLVLMDSDDDCAAGLGRSLLNRATQVTALPVAVILAVRELEAWFLGAKESLRWIRGIRGDATVPADPENIRGAKERLTRNMETGRRYFDVDDQPAFAQSIDISATRLQCPSFDKFIRDFHRLIHASRAL